MTGPKMLTLLRTNMSLHCHTMCTPNTFNMCTCLCSLCVNKRIARRQTAYTRRGQYITPRRENNITQRALLHFPVQSNQLDKVQRVAIRIKVTKHRIAAGCQSSLREPCYPWPRNQIFGRSCGQWHNLLAKILISMTSVIVFVRNAACIQSDTAVHICCLHLLCGCTVYHTDCDS